MNKVLLFIIALMVSHNAFSQSVKNSKKTTDTVFIFKHTNSHTDKISKKVYTEYDAVYIENNRSSKYYDWIDGFGLPSPHKAAYRDTSEYKGEIRYLVDTYKVKFHKHNLYGLPTNWCGLIRYKGSYYTYAPCDWMFNFLFQINDSTIIRRTFENDVQPIVSFKKISSRKYQLKTYRTDNEIGELPPLYNFTTNIYILDTVLKIAVFEVIEEGIPVSNKNRTSYSLMVSADKIKEFPIIVNYCPNDKVGEFEGDTIYYKALIKGL